MSIAHKMTLTVPSDKKTIHLPRPCIWISPPKTYIGFATNPKRKSTRLKKLLSKQEMIYAKLVNGSFDIIDQEETLSSVTRTPALVRLSYRDEQNRLITFEKLRTVAASSGSLLVAKDGALIPTNDRRGPRTVAKLLADPNSAVETKTQMVGLVEKTLHLLPVQIL